MNKISFALLIYIVLAISSCQHHTIPKRLEGAEVLLSGDRNNALKILDGMKDEIRNENEYAQMYYQILLFRAKDLCYISHTRDSIITKVVDYCLRYGDNELKMQAYYCLGCYFRDKKDPRQALVNYQKALSYSKESKNNSLIGRIYNQMGHIELFGYACEEALPLYKKALYYFKLAKDSLTIPQAIVDIAHVYDSQNKKSYYLSILKMGYSMASKLKDKSIATKIANEISGAYYLIGDDDSAKTYISKVNPILLHTNQDKAVYYSNKGKICYTEDKVDSSKSFFKSSIVLADNESKKNAYDELRQIYQNGKDYRNALKYSLLCSSMMKEIQEETHQKEVAQLQSLYNYTIVENKNNTLKAQNKGKQLIIVILISVLLLMTIIVLIYRQQSISRHEMQNKVIQKLEDQQKLNKEHIREKEKEIERLTANNKNNNLPTEIELLHLENERVKNEMKQIEIVWLEFRNSEIYRSFHRYIDKNKTLENHKCIEDYFSQIRDMIDKLFNNFGQRLKNDNPDISKQQLCICYLIKAEFTPSEMSIILSVGKQAISNIRHRMSKKYFAGINTFKTFDEFIHDF